MANFWVGIASREHVLAAVRGGFCQLNHGRESPVRRLQMGDCIIFYSPTEHIERGEALGAFTAVGRIVDEAAYQVEQSHDFRPFRRKTRYFKCRDAPIHPILEELSFTKGLNNWGITFRRGVFQINREDYMKITTAMEIRAEEGSE